MALTCIFSFHAWDGCICTKCTKTRDEGHDWSKDCEKCAKCGKTRSAHFWDGCKCTKCTKTRDEGHDWSKDCEKCAKCGKIRSGVHTGSGCKCLKCGSWKHEWYGFSCSLCGQLDYLAMMKEMYYIGKRCSIIGFFEYSKDQYITKLSEYNNEDEKMLFVGKQHNYLVGVIKQMFNAPLIYGDAKTLNQIAEAIKKVSRMER